MLRSDAEILAEAMTRNQAEELGAMHPYRERAMWVNTEEGQEALRQERREARERYQRMWGKVPGW